MSKLGGIQTDMDTNQDIAFQILADGPIAMYHTVGILDKDLQWFRTNNYSVYDLDTKNWSGGQAHADIKKSLDFPDYYGENMAAFNDCLGDMISPDHKGVVLVFRHFDNFLKADKKFGLDLLHIIAEQSRQWLLNRQRLIGIVQSDDPWLTIEKIGGTSPIWNRQEWLNKDRVKE